MFWALRSYRAGAKVVVSDVCVPISRLAECVLETKRDIDRSNLIAPIVGHVGDGNFHASVLVMMDDPDEVARTRALLERIAERSLAVDGTCTGEHGIGEGKKHFMVAEHGQSTVNLMAAIKHANRLKSDQTSRRRLSRGAAFFPSRLPATHKTRS